MIKKIITLFVSIVCVGLVAVVATTVFKTGNQTTNPTPTATTTPLAADPKNATYTIAGVPVTLTNGVSIVDAAPGSASKITTRYFGNEVLHDLNGDGRDDTAFILTQDNGGSGTFYYAAAALNTPNGYIGSDGFLLGDRIAPQATTIDEGTTTMGTKRQNVIVFNFAVRKPGESFATPPSVGKSVWLLLDPKTMQFGEVAQNFEGESSK